HYPNLVDDAWLWGGSVDNIHATIAQGRQGYMPPFKNTFTEEQFGQVAEYVLSLSGHEVNAELAAEGEKLFQGSVGGCYACHTQEGTGLPSVGSANLTDSIWTV